MGQGKIIIALKDGKVITKTEIQELSQAEMGMLIAHFELMKLEYLAKYKSNIKRIDKPKDE